MIYWWIWVHPIIKKLELQNFFSGNLSQIPVFAQMRSQRVPCSWWGGFLPGPLAQGSWQISLDVAGARQSAAALFLQN